MPSTSAVRTNPTVSSGYRNTPVVGHNFVLLNDAEAIRLDKNKVFLVNDNNIYVHGGPGRVIRFGPALRIAFSFQRNRVVDMRALPTVMSCSIAAMKAAYADGAVADGNTYWVPNAESEEIVFDEDTGTMITMDEFHDRVGFQMWREENPNWSKPEQGNFTDSGRDPRRMGRRSR